MADGQTGPAIKYAFEQLGHTIIAVDAKREAGNSYATACYFLPDLIFCSRTWQLTEQIVKIKEKFNKITICMWNTDTRNNINEWQALFPLIQACDYYFVVASNLIPEWKELNKNTYWLPQGLQNEVYHKPDRITKSDRLKYECDVSFAGSCTGYHAWRLPYLEAIKKMGINFKHWGWSSPRVYNEEHNKMVACSKINLGMSGWHKNGKYVSVRDYKILGAGGFLLEHCQDGIFDVLQRGTFDFYFDIETLIDAIKYWLNHREERGELPNRGYQWVHSHATYTHRIQRALEIMGLK